MITLIKIIYESIAQAFGQLVGNKLRTFLSLLGVTIGIFCIVGVQAAIDSLENELKTGFSQLGDDVIYIQKFEWKDHSDDWWEILRRPSISFSDYEKTKEKSQNAEFVTYFVELGRRTAKFRSNSAEGVDLSAVTFEYNDLFDLDIEKGRYFSAAEYRYGAPKCIIGGEVATALFGERVNPIGEKIDVRGKKMEIVGVLKTEGESMVDIFDSDRSILIGYEYAKKIANVSRDRGFGSSTMQVKARAGVPIEQLKDEITGILRANKKLAPREDNNFAMNELTMVTDALGEFFKVLDMIGWIIGGFAILVGGFSVANIMFVSVKERTGIIGVKKALGAKNYMILMEFLIEASILCLIGGVLGLGLIVIATKVLSSFMPFELFLSPSNMFFGVSLSIFIGVLSGFFPAFKAANMDPVEAIRS